jgi:D-3-phosphoglycerate dehydrogenase
MTKVLVATEKPFAPAAVQGIREIVKDAGYELVLLEKYTDKAQLLSAIADVDAVIVRSDKITSEVLDAAKNLKIAVRAGAGYDNIDLEAATEKKVVVMNTPGQNANAVAELVMGMMVYYARNFFNGKSGTELKGKKIGLDAFGHVGKNVARVAQGFDMKVYTYDPFVNNEEIKKLGVTPVDSVEALFELCEYVSLHIPANEKTTRSINFELMNKLPENGVLVNAARGEVIDEEGLLKMFEVRPDFAYLADIQPDCKDEIAQKYPGRYFFTPKKMGAQTEEANINAGLAAANQIRDYLEKGITTFQVNK